MNNSETVRALARLLVGQTWAHYDVSSEGLKLLADIIFGLPDISAYDWEDLYLYWDTPIGENERARLGQALLNQLHTREQGEIVKHILDESVRVDGRVTSEESALLREAGSAIDRGDPILIAIIERLLGLALPKRAQNMNAQTNYLQTIFVDRVMQRFEDEFGGDAEGVLGLEEDERWKLIYTGTLMGRVAYVDYGIDEQEVATMRRILQRDWGLSEHHALIVVEFAGEAAVKGLDIKRLSRHFFDLTSYQERVEFLDILFEIARAHAGITDREVAEIERIARALKMYVEDFEDAKLRALQRVVVPQ
jgi:uncharacterized tellurite resistance protein B-like protein